MGKISATKRYTFEACHFLRNYNGKCANLHGHSYKLEVTFSSSKVDSLGMIIDFNKIDDFVKPIVARYDHSQLNTFFEQPTAELMAVSILAEIRKRLNSSKKTDESLNGVYVSQVKLWETEKCYVTVD